MEKALLTLVFLGYKGRRTFIPLTKKIIVGPTHQQFATPNIKLLMQRFNFAIDE